MKKLSPITLCWVSILGCIIFIAVLCIRGDRSQSINYNNIRKIQLGIAKEDVLSILGMPSAVDGDTFKYTQKALPFGCYSKLWVHFESNCVREVYGKKKNIFWDEEDVYWLSAERGVWESISFEYAFPQKIKGSPIKKGGKGDGKKEKGFAH